MKKSVDSSSPRARFRNTLVAAAAMALANASFAAPSATVIFSTGDVHVVPAAGPARPAAAGQVIESGDTVQTGKGRIQLRMVDGALISLSEETSLKLDDYQLASAAGNDERGFMSLLKGALRTVSGTIGKARPDQYKLDTPAGTIGIRGTEYTAAVEAGLRVGVIDGRVAVCNDGGCVDVPRGLSAFAPDRSVRPVVSPRLSLVLPPAGRERRVHAPDAATGEAATTVAVAPVAGDGVASSTSTLMPAPELAPAPGGAPAPAPAPGPTPAPPAAPAPAPAPSTPPPTYTPAPPPAGNGTVGFVWTTDDQTRGASVAQGARTYSPAGGLTELDASGGGPRPIREGVVVDPASDGIVAWGRWTGGRVHAGDDDDDDNGTGRIVSLHYYTFAGQPSLPVAGRYTSFASTAPTVTSGGALVATGNVNSASGAVHVAFLTASGGSASYVLSVPVPGQTFTLTGTARQTSSFTFSGASQITSTGTGCAGGCQGLFGGGDSVRGVVGGTGASRVGVGYGFGSGIGDVTGVIVFQR